MMVGAAFYFEIYCKVLIIIIKYGRNRQRDFAWDGRVNGDGIWAWPDRGPTQPNKNESNKNDEKV